MTMSGTHTEAVSNKLTKLESAQLLLKTEATRGSQIADLSKEIKGILTYLKKLEADVSAVRTVNDKLVEMVVKTEKQFWENAQYSRRETLVIDGIPNSIGNSVLEETVRGVSRKAGVEIDERYVQTYYRLKEKERSIVKFVNRKDCLQILRLKKELKFLDPRELDFPENTKIFINESLCPYYRGIWNKCKKLRVIQKIHQFYTIGGLIVKLWL